MPDLLVRRQERFVLKSEMSWRAQGVTIGRDTAPADWAALVATAVEAGDHIAQELVEPVPHRLGFTGRSGSTFTDDIHPVFSPFIFDGRPGGMCLRYLPPGNAPGVVGSTTVNSLLSVALTTRS